VPCVLCSSLRLLWVHVICIRRHRTPIFTAASLILVFDAARVRCASLPGKGLAGAWGAGGAEQCYARHRNRNLPSKGINKWFYSLAS